LRNAVSAAASSGSEKTDTRLLVLDTVLPSAARSVRGVGGVGKRDEGEDEETKARREIPGKYQGMAESPLLPNWGYAGGLPYCADLIVRLVLSLYACVCVHTITLD
jgi:hypothetical protein